MTEQCVVCADSDSRRRDCRYCTGVYCPEHALPERHDCPGVEELKTSDEWFFTSVDDGQTEGREVEPRPEPLDRDEVTTYRGADGTGGLTDVTDGATTGERSGASGPRSDSESGAGGVRKLLSRLKFWA